MSRVSVWFSATLSAFARSDSINAQSVSLPPHSIVNRTGAAVEWFRRKCRANAHLHACSGRWRHKKRREKRDQGELQTRLTKQRGALVQLAGVGVVDVLGDKSAKAAAGTRQPLHLLDVVGAG